MTVTEKIIWDRVCKNQLGVRIRRQHPVWKFIADFYCHEVKLIIEIDGEFIYDQKIKNMILVGILYLKNFKLKYFASLMMK